MYEHHGGELRVPLRVKLIVQLLADPQKGLARIDELGRNQRIWVRNNSRCCIWYVGDETGVASMLLVKVTDKVVVLEALWKQVGAGC